jgi:hypothetical protein
MTTLTLTHAPLVFIDLATLEEQVTEAREAYNEAGRATNKTTVEEGYTVAQWLEARHQETLAQAHYYRLWNELDQLKAQLLQENTCDCRELSDGRLIVCDYCAKQADLRELLY